MPENIFLDGQGSFNHNTKNAGTIKWGEFNNAAVNTGSIVLSAVFTGSSVNSGTIGDLMPVYTVSVFQANSGYWNSTYSTVAANSASWGQGGGGSSDWNDITNKPTEFTPSAHFHHASAINAGVLDPARIPVINTSIQIISIGGLADLTVSQQNDITKGALVTTTDGQRYVYTSGDKTSSASYIQLADITPEWSVIANKPSEFTPSTHSHSISEVTGLQSAVTWVSENSSSPAIINYIFDNNTAAVNVNSKGSITIPSNFNITEWKIIADTASTTTITLNKSTYDSYPNMTSVGSVTLNSGRKNLNSSPGFENLSANDILEFLVSANSAATKITVSLKGYKI